MTNKYEVNSIAIESILTNIREKEIAIPEIQRPFVWDSKKIRDLIDSLYTGYPIGYIVTWKNPDVKLKDGTLSSGKKVLIDGQQRILALTTSIIGEEITLKNYQKKRKVIAFNPLKEVFEVSNPAIEKDSEWISDISIVFKSDFSIWMFISKYCKDNNIDINQSDKIGKAIDKLLQIKNNRVGIIELSHTLDIETITEIFIRINSAGVGLSPADFVMSKISSNETYDGNIIRKIIDYFCHLAQNSKDFEMIKNNDTDFANTDSFRAIKWIAKENENLYIPSYTDLLRVAFTSKFFRGELSDLVSLLSGRDFETREYREEIAEESFKLLYQGVLDFVNETNFKRYIMIVKSAGIIDSSLIKSQNVLNFGYILYLTLKNKGIKANKIESVVRRWIILSMLTGRYSKSIESSFSADIKKFKESDDIEALIKNVEEGELSDAFWNNILVNKLNTSNQNPYFNIFLIAQINSGNKGFLSKNIDVRSLIEQRGDIHHIFPKKYLQKNGINSKGDYNKIANYVYTQTEINIKIKDTAPKLYFDELKKQCENKSLIYGNIDDINMLKDNLAQNAIPLDIFDMDVKDYDKFINKRILLMAEKIKKYYQSLI